MNILMFITIIVKGNIKEKDIMVEPVPHLNH